MSVGFSHDLIAWLFLQTPISDFQKKLVNSEFSKKSVCYSLSDTKPLLSALALVYFYYANLLQVPPPAPTGTSSLSRPEIRSPQRPHPTSPRRRSPRRSPVKSKNFSPRTLLPTSPRLRPVASSRRATSPTNVAPPLGSRFRENYPPDRRYDSDDSELVISLVSYFAFHQIWFRQSNCVVGLNFL